MTRKVASAGREPERSSSLREVARGAVVTCLGIGRVPLAGPTLASLVTALAGWSCWHGVDGGPVRFRLAFAAVVLAATAGCVMLERWAVWRFRRNDPREVVLDEVAGMSLTLMFLPGDWEQAEGPMVAIAFAVAFLCFRFFDGLKPGIRWLDRADWRGAIVWDDLLAGVYSGATVWALCRWWIESGG